MTSWAEGPLCGFDLETSGVDYNNDRIITAVVIHIAPGRAPDVHEWMIAPDVEIPESATAIHKITTEYAREHGRPALDVIGEIGDQLRAGWTAGAVVVGHNIAFDLSFIDRETRRWLDRPFQISGPVADSFVIDKYVEKYRKGSRKLTAVAAHYGVPLAEDVAHDATQDAFAAARVLWKLCRQYPEIGALDRRELWKLQVKAHRDQATGLQDHLRKKARDAGTSISEIEAIVVEPDWPMFPLPLPLTAAATEPEGPTP